MISSTQVLREPRPYRNYVLRLVNELLALETSVSRGKSRFPEKEFASRLMLVDRLLTLPLPDLASFGIALPLLSPAAMIRTTIAKLEQRRMARFPEEAAMNPPIEAVVDS